MIVTDRHSSLAIPTGFDTVGRAHNPSMTTYFVRYRDEFDDLTRAEVEADSVADALRVFSENHVYTKIYNILPIDETFQQK